MNQSKKDKQGVLNILSPLLIFILLQSIFFYTIKTLGVRDLILWQVITNLISFGIVFFWVQKNHQRVHKRFLHFSFRIKKSFAYYGLLIIITYSTAIISEYITCFFPMPVSLLNHFLKAAKPSFINGINLIFIAPALEEVLFRGLIYQKLQAFTSAKKTIFFSAFLFGIVHLNFWQAVPAFLIGLNMSYLRYKYQGSLLDTFFMHLVNNATLMWVVNYFHMETFQVAHFFVKNIYLHILIFVLNLLLLALSWISIKKVNPSLNTGNQTDR